MNLSWESLRSSEAVKNYQNLIANDAVFRAAFSSAEPVLLQSSDPDFQNSEEAQPGFFDSYDDSSAAVGSISTEDEPLEEPEDQADNDFVIAEDDLPMQSEPSGTADVAQSNTDAVDWGQYDPTADNDAEATLYYDDQGAGGSGDYIGHHETEAHNTRQKV